MLCVDGIFTGSRDDTRDLVHDPLFQVARHDIIQPLCVEAYKIYTLADAAFSVHCQFAPMQKTKL